MPRAPDILKCAYEIEPDGEIKGRMVKIAFNLMSEARDEILLDASQSSDEAVKRSGRADSDYARTK